MNNLSQKMQERLNKWRKNTTPVKSVEKIKTAYIPRKDKGDIYEKPRGKDEPVSS
jgi:hypothetical protein